MSPSGASPTRDFQRERQEATGLTLVGSDGSSGCLALIVEAPPASVSHWHLEQAGGLGWFFSGVTEQPPQH